MSYSLWADVIAGVHVAYATFVVAGLLLIWIGVWRRWEWVRNLWFRLIHGLAIVLVVVFDISQRGCPLTVWEDALRQQAGQPAQEGTCFGRCLHNALAFDFAPWIFTTGYGVFALLVIATFILAPPRRRQGRKELTG